MARAHTFNTMTKADLIAALEDVPDDALITFASDYGDHSHTQQVHELNGTIEERTIHESGYSDSGWALVDDEDAGDFDDEDGEDGLPTVWVIS